MFVDANHLGNVKDNLSQTGVLIFVNEAPIHWYIKNQPSVETSTFGAEFYAIKVGVDMLEAFRYKMRMFGLPLDGAANVFCANEVVY